jgi:ATP-dependent Clp protease ATP-binding subunit ClpC
MFDSEISQKLTLHAKKSLKESQNIAHHCNTESIQPEHLFFAVYLEEGSVGSNILKGMGVKRTGFNKLMIGKNNLDTGKKLPVPYFSQQLKDILTRSYALANNFGYPYVGTEHLIHALIESDNKNIQKIIHHSKIKNFSLENILHPNSNNDLFPNLSKLFDLGEISLTAEKKAKKSNIPYLEQFCVDINKDAISRNEIIIAREPEIERIITILGRKNKNNPLLLGEPGVGKTAIIYGLAQKINSGDVPPNMLDKKILSLDLALVVAGTTFRGEFEMRLKEIIKETTSDKDIVLFIDEIHSIIGTGNASGGLDAANILKPALSRGDISCIGATTFSEYKKHIERDPALERRFQPIRIAEPNADTAKTILSGVKANYEKFHNINISPEAINQAVELAVRYLPDKFLPDKALDIMDETASAIRNNKTSSAAENEIKKLQIEKRDIGEQKNELVQKENYDQAATLLQKEKELEKKITELARKQKEIESKVLISIAAKDISRTVSRITGIPIEKMSAEINNDAIKNLEKNLGSLIIGQEEATSEITNVLRRTFCGISNPDRPLGSFLFLGPTGVGKTLTAKILARELFADPKALIRIDMSEFMEKHNIARLTGAPAGYVGYEEGGKLTEKIRHRPYSVVLFDEIEKAHPDVWNILLQILEDGTLTDAEGKQVNFKNTIIILTSNLGTSEFTKASQIGFGSQLKEQSNNDTFSSIKNKVLEELKKQMKPEILNRLDHVFVFNPLGKKELKKITLLEMETLKKRLGKQGLNFNYSPAIANFIAEKSLAPDQGARLIRKNIQMLVENEIAKALIAKKNKEGEIKLDLKKEQMVSF